MKALTGVRQARPSRSTPYGSSMQYSPEGRDMSPARVGTESGMAKRGRLYDGRFCVLRLRVRSAFVCSEHNGKAAGTPYGVRLSTWSDGVVEPSWRIDTKGSQDAHVALGRCNGSCRPRHCCIGDHSCSSIQLTWKPWGFFAQRPDTYCHIDYHLPSTDYSVRGKK